MPQLSCPIPKGIVSVALSGGSDSVFALEFIEKTRKVTPIFIDHKTETSRKALSFVQEYCYAKNLPLITKTIDRNKPKDESWEEFWRNQRYNFFHQLKGSVVTGHHLEDAVETYVFNMINGRQKVMSNRNKNVVRPFLFFDKEVMRSRASLYIEDETNLDLKYARNRIRHMILPEIRKVNPGISKTVRRLMKEEFGCAQS